MNTRNYFCIKLMLGACLLACSQLAWSLGLGEAKVESFLGQPLEVTIELITRPSDDLASVSASLASAEDYELIGASRDDISVPLRFSVQERDGNTFIKVSSKLAVGNPVVRLILEVNWSSGRMLREYTLFLDPATYSQPAPPPRVEPESTTQTQPAPPRVKPETTTQIQPATPPRVEPDRTIETQTTQPVPEMAVPSADDMEILESDDYGPVQSGETLWAIARDWSAGSGHNINKVMLAIQRQNPHAFLRNNINLLKRGVILRMPDTEDIESLSASSAVSAVMQQSDAFNEYRGRTVSRPAVPVLAEESAAIAPAAEPAAGDKPISAAAQTDAAPSQLELLPPSEDSSLDSTYGIGDSEAATDDAATDQALREELSRKEEELINQQQQNAYLEQRLQELEGQLAESRGGTVDDESLASMEERLRQERLGEPQPAVPKVMSGPEQAEPWYSRYSLWLLGLLVLVAVAAGWMMSRRGSAVTEVSEPGSAADSLSKFREETEEVPQVPDSSKKEQVLTEEAAEEEETEEIITTEPEAPAAVESEEAQTTPAGKILSGEDEEAAVPEEENADPEIQLDLARAYISMGDREAARIILDEVIDSGSEEQQAEANKMKESL